MGEDDGGLRLMVVGKTLRAGYTFQFYRISQRWSKEVMADGAQER